MKISISSLTATAGVCAGVAGVLYAGVQISHPPADLAHITGTDFRVREIAKMAMAVLAIAGLTGMLVRNRERFGAFGVSSYVLVVIGYFAMFANQVIVACVLPTLAATDPGYVRSYLEAATGGSPEQDLGGVQVLFVVTGLGYSVGGLLFGLALFRAGVLARWACLLFSAGTVAALALAVLPESFNRPFAVPVGVALLGLGVSLWQHRVDAGPARTATAQAVPVGR